MTDLHTKFLLLLTVFLWGISGALQKVAVGKMSAPAMQLVTAMTLLCVVSVYYIVTAMSQPAQWSTGGTCWAVTAAVLSALGSICFVLLLRGQNVSSIMGYAACYPLVTFIIAILFMGEAFTTTRLVGICLVLFGLMILGR